MVAYGEGALAAAAAAGRSGEGGGRQSADLVRGVEAGGVVGRVGTTKVGATEVTGAPGSRALAVPRPSRCS